MDDSAEQLRTTLLTDGVLRSRDAVMAPLSGGVSSEIYLVHDGERRFVVKRALEKLKVEQDWFADTSRNQHEWSFMQYVARFRPDAMPGLLAENPQQGYFCMEYLEGFANWKQELLAGDCDTSIASRAGALLGEIHNRSWGDQDAERDFDTITNFDQLRIDPYLRATAARHTDVREILLSEAQRLATTRKCLVHGDFSPKNLLRQGERLVALDCEVAWYGDPAFDLAFLLNHLFLKSLYHAPRELPFDELIAVTISSYRGSNPRCEEVEPGASRLLPMLMLARIDGKSPVEYLTDSEKQNFVRAFSIAQVGHPLMELDELTGNWFKKLNELTE